MARSAATAAPRPRPRRARPQRPDPRARAATARAGVATPALPRRILDAPFARAARARTGGVLDALLAGRGWIVLIGLLLAGIVFFNVDLLQMNRDIARDAERAATLKRENGRLRLDVARLASSERIQEAAARLGLVLPAPGEVRYLKARPAVDPQRAAKNISEPSTLFSVPAPALAVPPVAGAPTTPGATTATPPATPTIDPVTGATVDPATGQAPIDPATGAPIDPATGAPIDPATGAPLAAAPAAAAPGAADHARPRPPRPRPASPRGRWRGRPAAGPGRAAGPRAWSSAASGCCSRSF